MPGNGQVSAGSGPACTGMTYPVIIMGMHRSGTSMISRVLEGFGLFMGRRKQHDNESLFFHGLNNWLISQCGGSWDNPRVIHDLMRHREARELAARYIRFIMRTPRFAEYLGWKGYLRGGALDGAGFSWGWKDPRNTFTLPLWLDLFPSARVIHILRHGVDVAHSLCTREAARFRGRNHPIDRSFRRLVYVVRPKKGGFADSLRCATLEGGFSLWEEYLEEGGRHAAALGERVMEIRYEDFLAEPRRHLPALSAFCGLRTNDSAIERAALQVNASRAFAYRQRPELREFSLRVAPRLQAHGY